MRLIAHPSCTRCSLHTDATNPGVPTVAHPFSDPDPSNPFILFVGQNPGYNEDQTNTPFVGPSGKILNTYINGISLHDHPFTLYKTNAVRCFTVNNETPRTGPIRHCSTHLHLDLVTLLNWHAQTPHPVVVALGAVAVRSLHYLFPDSVPNTLTKSFSSQGILVRAPAGFFRFFSTFHPAAVMRNRNLSDPVGDHMQLLLDYVLDGSVPTPSDPDIVTPYPPHP